MGSQRALSALCFAVPALLLALAAFQSVSRDTGADSALCGDIHSHLAGNVSGVSALSCDARDLPGAATVAACALSDVAVDVYIASQADSLVAAETIERSLRTRLHVELNTALLPYSRLTVSTRLLLDPPVVEEDDVVALNLNDERPTDRAQVPQAFGIDASVLQGNTFLRSLQSAQISDPGTSIPGLHIPAGSRTAGQLLHPLSQDAAAALSQGAQVSARRLQILLYSPPGSLAPLFAVSPLAEGFQPDAHPGDSPEGPKCRGCRGVDSNVAFGRRGGCQCPHSFDGSAEYVRPVVCYVSACDSAPAWLL